MGERSEYPPGTFCWVDLPTPDPEAARTFYTELFGWTYRDVSVGEGQVYCLACLGEKEVAGLYPRDDEQEAPSCWASYVSVAGADDAAGRAAAAGATVLAAPFDVIDAGRMAVVRDPTGAVFNLWEPQGHFGAELVNQHGALCWNELLTNDTARAGEFYTSLCGWRTEPFGEGYTLFLVQDRGNAGMMAIDQERMGPVPPNWSVYFAVDDCDAASDRAAAAGGQVRVPPGDIPEVGRFAVLVDPQGAEFGVIQLLRASD